MTSKSSLPVLAFTQGDPAGVGPELLFKLCLEARPYKALLVAEEAALESCRAWVASGNQPLFRVFSSPPERDELVALGSGDVGVLDPVGVKRTISPGTSGAADARAALACLDAGIALARGGVVDALVTAPLSKESIARHCQPEFRGHTDYLASACGLERYGRDYLMTFLAEDLQVALLTTHLPLASAVRRIASMSRTKGASEGSSNLVAEAIACLDRHAGGRIAVAGLNPHAGEGGLMGTEDAEVLAPAVAEARSLGLDVSGPFPADSLFARARRGEFDWILALYHDQGLIPVKTVAFGAATNWTLGLPFVRTSVDHGTAFDIAGTGVADAGPLLEAARTTCRLLAGELPRRRF